MSLFLCREWWSADGEAAADNAGGGTNTAAPNFCCYTMAAFPSELASSTEVIICGFTSGMLKVFSPFQHRKEDGTMEKAFAPDNLLLELQMEEPILQLTTGNLTSSSGGDPKLCILHPRLVTVYSLQCVKSKGKGTSDLDSLLLNVQYQHRLSRSAFSLTVGPFGGGKKDFLCVQSLDGAINVFEQESFAFSRFLPNFLLPGPLVYVPRTDSFVTVSSAYQLESYRYQMLAVSGNSGASKDKSDDLVTGKRLTADWILGLGEHAFSLQVITSPDKAKSVPDLIMVCGTRTLFAVRDTGAVVFMKKLDFIPVEAFSYRTASLDNQVMTLMATEHKTLLVFSNMTLKWAAQIPFRPALIRRGAFMKEKGSPKDTLPNLLVLGSSSGEVLVSYLGTDPSLFSAPPTPARDVNYEETDREYNALMAKIKAVQGKDSASGSVAAGGPSATASLRGDLTLSAVVSPSLERCFYPTEVLDDEADAIPMVKVTALLRSSVPLSKVRVTFSVQAPLAVSHEVHVVNSLTETSSLETYVFLRTSAVPACDLEVQVCAVYLSGASQSAPSVQSTCVTLPLALIVMPCPPLRDAEYKITIATNKPAVSLVDLYAEFSLDAGMVNAVGFKYYGGAVVTVLSSKSSQRYRLQSDNLCALWLHTKQLEDRLHRLHGGTASARSDLQCSYSSSLPMHEYFIEVDNHFNQRVKMKELLERLSQRSNQFRSIERRLLARFKDKTPTALDNLDTLLETTHRQLMKAADDVDACTEAIDASTGRLVCITNLLLLLVRLASGMSRDEEDKLRSALSPVVHVAQEQGWEETTDAALTFLLRTSLAKAGKEHLGATPITLDVPKDVARLKKHISTVMDRVGKGARVDESKPMNEGGGLGGNLFDLGDVVSEERAEPAADGDALPGTRLGEAGERLRSARARTKDVTVTQQSQNITRGDAAESPPSPSADRRETEADRAQAAMAVETDDAGVPNGGGRGAEDEDEEVRDEDDEGDSIFD